MPTQEERILELNPPRHKNVHYTWHKFCDYMKKWFYEMVPNWVFSDGKIVRDGTKSKSFDSEKMVGYKAVCRLRKYSKRKDGIDLVSCDDSYHMRSNIALIQHRESNHFMGVTMILVPQCARDINQVFLYPEHLNYLIEKLTEIKNIQDQVGEGWDDE